jgi:precorrin-2 dehydrogenase/sirohydrochlorin ferrochelatase
VSGASYPVMLDLSRLRTLVVGGGAVGTRKAAGLVEAGGRPEILAPEVTDELRETIGRASLRWHARPYRTGDAAAYRLVFAATDDPALNQWIADDGRSTGALVSRADEGADSDFHTPAHVRRDEVVVAFSTGGASPLLARRLRERLEGAVVTPGLGRAARRLAQVRDEVQARWAAEFLDLAVQGRDEDVEQAIRRCLSQS